MLRAYVGERPASDCLSEYLKQACMNLHLALSQHQRNKPTVFRGSNAVIASNLAECFVECEQLGKPQTGKLVVAFIQSCSAERRLTVSFLALDSRQGSS